MARARGGFLISNAQGDGSLGALDKSSCETFQMMINVSHTFPAIDPTHVVLDDVDHWSTPFIIRVVGRFKLIDYSLFFFSRQDCNLIGDPTCKVKITNMPSEALMKKELKSS